MVCCTFWFAVMTATVRHLSQEMHPFVIVFWRNAVALACMLPWLWKNGLRTISTMQRKWYVLRGANGVLAMIVWFYALSLIPIATAISLSFTTPLFTTLIAVSVLKESVGIRRWVALFVGFLGTIVILRPGLTGFNTAYLWVIAASVLWSISNLIIKRLTATESPQLIVFYMTLFMTPFALPLAVFYWQWPSLSQWVWIILIGIASNLAQLCLSSAYTNTDMSVLQPFDFFRLIFAAIIGYFAFYEIPDVLTFLGAFIILCSTVYITYREAKLKTRARA
ncbi:MAG: DMT family transporter [Burkholderiales bacterium]